MRVRCEIEQDENMLRGRLLIGSASDCCSAVSASIPASLQPKANYQFLNGLPAGMVRWYEYLLEENGM